MRLQSDIIENIDGYYVRVPTHYESDGFTTPWFLKPLQWYLNKQEYVKAAFIHDYILEQRLFGRKQADRIFYYALRHYRCSIVMAWLLWVAVRIGGMLGY